MFCGAEDGLQECLDPSVLWDNQMGTQVTRGPQAAAAALKSLQECPTLCDPIDAAHQAPPSLGFSRQEYWSGVPLPSPGPQASHLQL